VIDSLRADKCYGEKSLQTPNINSLIKKGIYFTQAFTSIPATVGSLGGMLTGEYSFKTGINTFQHKSKIDTYFDILKKSNYNTYAMVPNTTYFNEWTKNFNDVDTTEMFSSLEQLGKKIIEKLESNKMSEPWMYYIHLMDLHADANEKFRVPKQFNKDEYGFDEYDKTISFIDYWIGKIFAKVDFENTLIVITSDHGHSGKLHSKNKIIKKFISKGKIFGSKFYGIGKNLLKIIRMTSGEHQEFFKLPDILLNTPLIFAGYKINKHNIINQLVRNIDIFPTILDIVNINRQENVSGRTLLPLFEGKKLEDLPIYIENKTIDLEMKNSIMGLRNSSYKYYRDKNNPNSKVNLYDLNKDPNENENIATEESQIIIQMEKILEKMKMNTSHIENSEITDDEEERVKEELKKLGYI
jgi:arylsulfatase A-like enzyme